MRCSKRAVLSALAMLGAVALSAAASDIMQKSVSDPGAFWSIWGKAKTNYVTDARVKGGAAERVAISPKPQNPWDIGASIAVTKPVHKGDVLLLMFWARAEKPPSGSDLVMLSGRIYESGPSGAGVSPETTFLIGREWKLYYANGTAAKDYPVGTLSAGMVLGTGDMVIDYGPVSIIDLGPNYNLDWLPRS